MPGRIIPLVTGETYHVFNRGIDKRPTFIRRRNYSRFIETIKYYRFQYPPIRLARFLELNNDRKNDIYIALMSSDKNVDILTYCLMPNHFHFLLTQKIDKGISRFLSNLQNSYTRYFNTLFNRDGSLFLDQFKAVRIEDEEQLLHVHRYIHLNPFTSFVVKSLIDLEEYPWSSFSEYLNNDIEICQKEIILNQFHNRRLYKEFIFNQANYQRELDSIKHLIIESS